MYDIEILCINFNPEFVIVSGEAVELTAAETEEQQGITVRADGGVVRLSTRSVFCARALLMRSERDTEKWTVIFLDSANEYLGRVVATEVKES